VPSDFISTRSPTASGEKTILPWTMSSTAISRSGFFRMMAGFAPFLSSERYALPSATRRSACGA